MARIEPEPYHEPIGFSEESFAVSRRWLGLAFLIVASLVAAVLVALRP